MEQRNGRAVRKGNTVKLWGGNVVDVVIYGTEKTLDAYKFNLLKNKQMFIDQINNGTIAVRRIDEGGMDEESGMNFAEFVAILSGNTDLLEKAKLDNKIALLEKEQGVFKRERVYAERQIADKPQATAEEIGRELHRIAKFHRIGAYSTIGTYAGLNLLVRSEYNMGGFDRNTFFVEGISGLKYCCGVSGALPLGYADSAHYPQAALDKLPGLIDKEHKLAAKLESEIPVLQEIANRQWSKDEDLKDAEHSRAEEPQASEYEPEPKAA